MEIPTVFGMTWKIPSFYDISIILIITFSIILILLFLRYYIQLQEKKAHEYQLFLFKTRHMGLSGFQIKILNGIVKSLKLKDPNIILNNSTLYESALGNFLIYLKDQVLEEESLFSISKDVIIIYEKLYHPASFEKPLEKLPDIKLGKLVYFTFKNSLFIGKLAEKDDSNFSIQLFRNPKELYILKKDIPVKVYFFRPGDAEYTFNTIITNIDEQIIDIAIPEDFTRGKEVRHPNIDVIIKCIISYVKEPVLNDEPKQFNGIIFKLNIDEAILRLEEKLDYNIDYYIRFEIWEFKIKIVTNIIADRTIKEENLFYYTFKFKEMSNPAMDVLHKYIMEHLS